VLDAESEGGFWARKGEFYIMAAAREKGPLATIDLKEQTSGTVAAANGGLYVATITKLFAFKEGARFAPRP
jgi:hypothetical protein